MSRVEYMICDNCGQQMNTCEFGGQWNDFCSKGCEREFAVSEESE